MAKLLVGLSGGVDSAVAAYQLKQAGHEVIGITLRTWETEEESGSRCCEIDDARNVASQLGIPFHVVNCSSLFKTHVTGPFVCEYLRGRTPNPCVVCNQLVKWAKMTEWAGILQADGVATGHYATVVKLKNGRYSVKTAVHAEKDQTYMLYRLSQEQLKITSMPLGALSKAEVRAIAEQAGIAVAGKPDSQEICFVQDGHYAEYIEAHADGDIPSEGNFVDESGRVLGRHKGIIHYTVGQRKGLGIALGVPAYVTEIRPETGEVVLGTEQSVYRGRILCEDIHYMGAEELSAGQSMRAKVKVRYHHAAQDALITATGDKTAEIVFDEPVRAAAPGQSAVFYDEDGCVLGGGIIA